MAAPSALLRAVILAACVAGAIAGAPSEEWAERLRLLETRVEQSDQREAEQLRLFETGIAQSKQRGGVRVLGWIFPSRWRGGGDSPAP